MRMWNIPADRMCRKHLLGEHVELHMFAGAIRKGISIAGYIRNKLVDLSLMQQRHEQLSVEMKNRGYKHKSRLVFPIHYGGRVDIDANKKELARRCPRCRKLLKDY